MVTPGLSDIMTNGATRYEEYLKYIDYDTTEVVEKTICQYLNSLYIGSLTAIVLAAARFPVEVSEASLTLVTEPLS